MISNRSSISVEAAGLFSQGLYVTLSIFTLQCLMYFGWFWIQIEPYTTPTGDNRKLRVSVVWIFRSKSWWNEKIMGYNRLWRLTAIRNEMGNLIVSSFTAQKTCFVTSFGVTALHARYTLHSLYLFQFMTA